MTSEDLPRQILTCGACVVSGFVLAMWCMPLLESKPRVNAAKPGFSISVPLSRLHQMTDSETMRGKSVRLLRASGPDVDPCVIEHGPLSFSTHENMAIFSGPLESMETSAIAITAADLSSIRLVDAGAATVTRSCRGFPKVTYGD